VTTTLYLIRHAEPDRQNHDDLTRALTEKGRRDTALVTACLTGKRIAAVYSSPYRRALDTVRPFAEQAGLTIRVDADLRERAVGGWIEDFWSFAARQWADFDFALPDGESLRQVQARCLRALSRILADCPGQAAAAGGHGTAICALLNALDPSFGFPQFRDMVDRMPWAVCLRFDGPRCTEIEETDLFSGAVTRRLPERSRHELL